MKKIIFIVGLIIFSMQALQAQTKDYKVVFDLTSKDSLDQRAVIRWLNEISTLAPEAKMEVVMYGHGMYLVTRGRSVAEDEIAKLSANKNISFKVCAVALKNQHIDKNELLPGIKTVPDGIYEIISKQREGWGYIKAVH